MESVINTTPSKGLRGFADECHKTFKEQIIALFVWAVGKVVPRASPTHPTVFCSFAGDGPRNPDTGIFHVTVQPQGPRKTLVKFSGQS